MLYGGWGIRFGSVAEPPETIDAGSSIRLYSLEELHEILHARGMEIVETRESFSSRPANADSMQMEVFSRRLSR